MLSIDATWEDPTDDEANISWARAFWDDAHRFSQDGKTYFNFPGLLEEGEGADAPATAPTTRGWPGSRPTTTRTTCSD